MPKVDRIAEPASQLRGALVNIEKRLDEAIFRQDINWQKVLRHNHKEVRRFLQEKQAGGRR